MSVFPRFSTVDSTVKVSPVKIILFVARNGKGNPVKAPAQSQVNSAIHFSLSASKLLKAHSAFCKNPWSACGAQLTLFTSW